MTGQWAWSDLFVLSKFFKLPFHHDVSLSHGRSFCPFQMLSNGGDPGVDGGANVIFSYSAFYDKLNLSNALPNFAS